MNFSNIYLGIGAVLVVLSFLFATVSLVRIGKAQDDNERSTWTTIFKATMVFVAVNALPVLLSHTLASSQIEMTEQEDMIKQVQEMSKQNDITMRNMAQIISMVAVSEDTRSRWEKLYNSLELRVVAKKEERDELIKKNALIDNKIAQIDTTPLVGGQKAKAELEKLNTEKADIIGQLNELNIALTPGLDAEKRLDAAVRILDVTKGVFKQDEIYQAWQPSDKSQSPNGTLNPS